MFQTLFIIDGDAVPVGRWFKGHFIIEERFCRVGVGRKVTQNIGRAARGADQNHQGEREVLRVKSVAEFRKVGVVFLAE